MYGTDQDCLKAPTGAQHVLEFVVCLNAFKMQRIMQNKTSVTLPFLGGNIIHLLSESVWANVI